MAIEAGYRHLDGALVYFNEHEVGQGIREKIADGTVKREDIFYCGKVCKACLLVCLKRVVVLVFQSTREFSPTKKLHGRKNDCCTFVTT